jgi:hypothetical protein
VWRLDGLRTGFCVQLLVNATTLDVEISRRARPLRADKVQDLHPALRSVVADQPEYAAWTPSTVCLYYVETVDVGSFTITERNPNKVPMIGVWTIAAADTEGGARKDAVLRLFTNTGRLERAGEVTGLDLREVRSKVSQIVNDEEPDAPPIGTRYEIKLGKTLLTWEGRRVDDSTQANGPLSAEWRAESRRRGPMNGRLLLTPQWTRAMVGVLQVEGKDAFAKAVKASPIRFVGPAMVGGGGELAFGR